MWKERDCMVYKKMVIGIDESYENCGISVFCDGQKKLITSIKFKSSQSKSEKREVLSSRLETFLRTKINTANEVVIIVERIRQFSGPRISMDYIKGTASLISTIVDVAFKYGIEVYSVDTRSWKSQIVGTSKRMENKWGINPTKYPTILFIKRKGWLPLVITEVPKKSRKSKGIMVINGKRYFVNDDACDSACIAMYGFLPKSQQHLKLET